MHEFLIRAVLGGIGVTIICGPFGCLVVWQRMSYFGAALSHAGLLGIALGLFLQLNLTLSMVTICIGISLLLLLMQKHRNITSDTALGILAHSSLAIGILVLGLIPGLRIDLMGYLFGDILSINWIDLIWIYGGGLVVLLCLCRIWSALLSLIIQRELALVDAVNEDRIRLIFLILLSFVIAVSMQIVGILLIVSLLIIPAATARGWSDSPEKMAGLSIIAGMLSVVMGLILSILWDTAAGPSIVACSTALYLISTLLLQIRSKPG